MRQKPAISSKLAQDTDRRIRRSKRDLAAALIELTTERPYASIQVRDVTDRADVGYATFYRHYESKDDLMLAVITEITSELESSAAETEHGYFQREGSLVFEHVQKYQGLYRSILQSQAFIPQLRKLLRLRIEAHMRSHVEDLDQAAFPMDLAANHMVVALMGLIEWWLEKKQSLPVEEMGRIYERLIIQATWYAMDRKNLLSWPAHD